MMVEFVSTQMDLTDVNVQKATNWILVEKSVSMMMSVFQCQKYVEMELAPMSMEVLSALVQKATLQAPWATVKMLMNVLNMDISVLLDATTLLDLTDVFARMDTKWPPMEDTVSTSMSVFLRPMIADMIVRISLEHLCAFALTASESLGWVMSVKISMSVLMTLTFVKVEAGASIQLVDTFVNVLRGMNSPLMVKNAWTEDWDTVMTVF